jgi:hypothetical protein
LQFLIRHCEKLALGFALVGLLVACYYMLHCLKVARSDVRDLQDRAGSIDSGRKVLDPIKRTPVKIDKLLDDPALLIKLTEGEGKGALVEPPRYIRCLNSRCMYLISYEMDDCPFCRAKQPPKGKKEKDVGADSDGDGIPDFVEGQYPFLSSRDETDAARDQDKDGFTNLEEFNATTKLDDPADHAPLITLVRYLKTFRRPIPVLLRKISTNGADDPARWDVTCQAPDKRGKLRNRLLRVGDEVNGYTILKATVKTGKRINPRTRKEEEGDVSEIVIQKGEDGPKYTLVVETRGFEEDYYVSFIYALDRYNIRRTKKYTKVAGQELKLPHRATRLYETYVVTEVSARTVTVKRADKGVKSETYGVKRYEKRKARELFLRPPPTADGRDGRDGGDGGMGAGMGQDDGMMEGMMPGENMGPGRTTRRQRPRF